MQVKTKENSTRSLIRTLDVGAELQFPVNRRWYVRTLVQEAQIDFDYSYTTHIDRKNKTIIVNRIK